MDRLDKILVSQNVGSRKEVQKLIKNGLVAVNGKPEKKPESKFTFRPIIYTLLYIK